MYPENKDAIVVADMTTLPSSPPKEWCMVSLSQLHFAMGSSEKMFLCQVAEIYVCVYMYVALQP